MKLGTFQIFKPGTHTPMSGKALHFSLADMQSTAASFSETIRPAPLVLGHPKHDNPAVGWVKKLSVRGTGLYATAEFSDELVEHVKTKRYPNVSAAFLPPTDPNNPKPGNWYLRHVGFLGAIAPAVKNLEPVAFAEFICKGIVDEAGSFAAAFAEELAQESDSDEVRRAAFHESILAYQGKSPGMSYLTAAQHIFNSHGQDSMAHKAFRGYAPPPKQPSTYTRPTSAVEAAFAEAREQGGDTEAQARAALHSMAQTLVTRNPGMSYAAAAHTAHNAIEDYQARHSNDSGMEPDRVAFHEAILAHQAAVPGLSYAAAAHQLMNSL